jgi:hypothetical protein
MRCVEQIDLGQRAVAPKHKGVAAVAREHHRACERSPSQLRVEQGQRGGAEDLQRVGQGQGDGEFRATLP